MAIIHPFNLIIEDIEADHGSAEAYIIKLINELDKEKTKDWIFYYSFSFKSKTLHRYKDCEIDFLCLLPDVGIFVFEIKGGKISKVLEDGEINYYSLGSDKVNYLIKNPYQQAHDNYYDFNNLLESFSIEGKSYTIFDFVGGYAVGFPNIDYMEFLDPLSDGKLLTFTKGKDLYRFFLSLGKRYYADYKRVPSKQDIDIIIKHFSMKDFTYKYDLGDYIDTVNVRINQLTDEQYTILRGLLENDRCLINGPAGSGKTILSEMLFKYFVNNHERVAFFSYNIFNSLKVKNDLDNATKDTKSLCAPLYEYIDELIKHYYPNKEFDNYLDKIKAINECHNQPDFPKYSVIIIDEAQDLEGNEDLIDLFENLSSKGLQNSKFFIFFDRYQSIFYNKNPFYNHEFFGEDGYRYARFSLIKNCRNSDNISDLLISMRNNKDKLLISSINNDSVSYKKMNDVNQTLNEIKSIINNLKNNGVKSKSISILLTSRGINDSSSPIYQINDGLKHIDGAKPYSVDNALSFITFTTVSKFKGLENDIIIYVRHYKDNAKYAYKDDYVAISRGKSLVYILDVIGK